MHLLLIYYNQEYLHENKVFSSSELIYLSSSFPPEIENTVILQLVAEELITSQRED